MESIGMLNRLRKINESNKEAFYGILSGAGIFIALMLIFPRDCVDDLISRSINNETENIVANTNYSPTQSDWYKFQEIMAREEKEQIELGKEQNTNQVRYPLQINN